MYYAPSRASNVACMPSWLAVDVSKRGRRSLNTEIVANHKIWKQYSPYFYDYVITHCLASTSQTFQWISSRSYPIIRENVRMIGLEGAADGEEYEVSFDTYEALVATCELPGSSSLNGVFRVRFKIESEQNDVRVQDVARYRSNVSKASGMMTMMSVVGGVAASSSAGAAIDGCGGGGAGGGLNASLSRMSATQVVKCDERSIYLVRAMPQNEDVIVVRTQKPHIPIYVLASPNGNDRHDGTDDLDDDGGGQKHHQQQQRRHHHHHHQQQQRSADLVDRPIVQLAGHSLDGYGLSWNPNKSGQLATCSRDRKVMLWDVDCVRSLDLVAKKDESLSNLVAPISQFTNHVKAVCDVKIHPMCSNMIVSVGADGRMVVQDTRLDCASHSITAHNSCANAIDHSRFNEYILATASDDCTIAVWDLRNLSECLVRLFGHADDILQLKWSPHVPCVLMSSSLDRTVNLWNMASTEHTVESDEFNQQHSPQLMFTHAGHTARVNDVDFNPKREWMVASTCTASVLQIWKMSDHLFGKSLIDVYGDRLPCVMELPQNTSLIGVPSGSGRQPANTGSSPSVLKIAKQQQVIFPQERGDDYPLTDAPTTTMTRQSPGPEGIGIMEKEHDESKIAATRIPPSALRKPIDDTLDVEKVRKSVSFRLEIKEKENSDEEKTIVTERIVRPGDISPVYTHARVSKQPTEQASDDYDDTVFRNEFGDEQLQEEQHQEDTDNDCVVATTTVSGQHRYMFKPESKPDVTVRFEGDLQEDQQYEPGDEDP